jgi:hypothetical protein
MITEGEILSELCSVRELKCPGCKERLYVYEQACAKCGEAISLEVVSTRQPRWADFKAFPIVVSLAAACWGCIQPLGAAVFIAFQLQDPALRAAAVSSHKFVAMMAALLVPALAGIAACTLLMLYRKRLLRANAKVRWGVCSAVLTTNSGVLYLYSLMGDWLK